MKQILREALAAYAHRSWSGWMEYLFKKSTLNPDGSATIPASLVARWRRQASTPYAALPAGERESDRVEADAILAAIRAAGYYPARDEPDTDPSDSVICAGWPV